MICFLTSRTDLPETNRLNPANDFAAELARRFPAPCDALFVCSDPDVPERTDFYAASVKTSFEEAGLPFRSFRVLDGRNAQNAAELVEASNFLILSGGHVPTQNRFFQSVGLRGLLTHFDGVLMGISAGSMNSADVVYAQPELEGEALDPDYRRFLPGLGLTKTMLIPHYQAIRDEVLDGLRVFEEITYPDSVGRCFYAIPDGSYLLIEDGREELRGEAWRILDGVLSRCSGEGERIVL